MGANFFPTRGCVYAIPTTGTGSDGLYRLNGVTDQKGSDSAILVTGLDLIDSDVFSPVITTENLKVLYVFGKAFGQVSLQGQVLLGSVGKKTDKMDVLQQWFQKNRVAVSKKPVELSVANKAYSVYVTGFTIGAAEAELNIQAFAVQGLIAD